MTHKSDQHYATVLVNADGTEDTSWPPMQGAPSIEANGKVYDSPVFGLSSGAQTARYHERVDGGD
jgi:hypothetical protein